MAMTNTQALELLAAAASLANQLTSLFPTLIANLQGLEDALKSDDADAVSAQIVATQAEIRAFDAQLQALRS